MGVVILCETSEDCLKAWYKEVCLYAISYSIADHQWFYQVHMFFLGTLYMIYIPYLNNLD